MRQATNWPLIVNLNADPFEKMPFESEMYIRWYADNMWLFVPIQEKIKEFLVSLEGYPFQMGSSFTASNLGYRSVIEQKALKQLKAAGARRRIMPRFRQ